MAEDLLDAAQVRAPLEQVARRAVPKGVRSDVVDAGLSRGTVDGGSHLSLVHPPASRPDEQGEIGRAHV